MKRRILVPIFSSAMALVSMATTVANADEVKNEVIENNKEDKTTEAISLPEYKETAYKVASIKDGVATKVRHQGSVQTVAYTGDEFKILGIQGDWVKVQLEDGEGWIASRFVDIKEAIGYTTSEKVNLRKEANVESEIIQELELGSSIKVLEADGNWMKVKKGEEEGYIRSLYVAEEAPVIEEEVVEELDTQVSNSSNQTNTENNTQNNQTSTNRPSSNSNTNNTSRPNSNNNANSGQAQKPVQKPSKEEGYNPPASSSSKVQAVINLAYSKIGSPYVWGAEGPNSFDCSGFTSYVFRNAAGISIPRTSSAQSGYGKTVSKSNLQPGDLVFFNTSGSGVSHVGIYVGGGNMVHSPSSGKSVSTASINSSYYSSRFVTAKRVL